MITITIVIVSHMKNLIKAVISFIKREWFLLITTGIIAIIIFLFEVL